TVGASPHAAEPTRKSTTPPRKTRLLPTRSARRPAGTSSEANTMLYALITHDRSPRVAVGKVLLIDGKAMFTIVASRKLMKTATDVTARMSHLRCMKKLTIARLSCFTQLATLIAC